MKLIEVPKVVKLNTLRSNLYFDELPDGVLKDIADSTQLREFERGDVLFWEDDACPGLHIIESGSVKLYRVSPYGRQYIITVLTEGATCNEVLVDGRAIEGDWIPGRHAHHIMMID